MVSKILLATLIVLSVPVVAIVILAICIVLMSRNYTGEKGDNEHEDTQKERSNG